jgi:predicted DCC family thiol-disulfide oxidoreductase YuxK
MPHPILLYDGVCGLCNRLVHFVLRRDAQGIFRFASLQSSVAHGILSREGLGAADLETVCVVSNPAADDQGLLLRSDAVLFVLTQLGGIWKMAASVLKFVPKAVRDWGYAVIAKNRYRIFGRFETCPLPSAETRSRFLDQ